MSYLHFQNVGKLMEVWLLISILLSMILFLYEVVI